MKTFSFCFLLLHLLGSGSLCAQTYDVVLAGGRVMDPESGLDAIRNVGINGNQIAVISESNLSGRERIDVTGLVVAPGFIDIHVHGMTNQAHEYQIHDGVTTALELEGGIAFLEQWLESKKGRTPLHYGASVPHGTIRAFAMNKYASYLEEARRIVQEEGIQSRAYFKVMAGLQRLSYEVLPTEDYARMGQLIQEELEAGALGIGIPVGYYPGASRAEIYQTYLFAAEMEVPIFSHTRTIGIEGIHEAIANAATSGATLHVVHANSLALGDIEVTLDMISDAQDRGLDISTEIYPYTAASTSIESAIFDEGWQEKLNISYGDIQWEATGERLTEKTFNQYRKRGGVVIIHAMQAEWILRGIQDSRTLIASDGMPYAPKAHPRSAGTFSRVLGRYVREQQAISLMEALRKITLMPAQRLESIAPMMQQKGRLQTGKDADITIFNPNTILDRADFTGMAFSEGIEYVLVNGTLVVKAGETVRGVYPGKAIIGKGKK